MFSLQDSFKNRKCSVLKLSQELEWDHHLWVECFLCWYSFFSVHTGITVKEPSDWQTTVRLSGHICIHTETHACMCRGVYEMHMHVLACAMCTGVCTWVHAHMWVCVHVNMYIFVCTPTCVLYMDRFIFVWAYEYARTDRHACLYVSGYASACVCTWA